MMPSADRGKGRTGGVLPEGFSIGHWSDLEAATGCTVVLPPADGAVASADVRGGGTGTREIELLGPLANPQRVHAVLLTGGSAFGLAAADGVMRWLERQGRGHPTPAGRVPLVPAAVLYDLASGGRSVRPSAEHGEAACEAGTTEPELGSVGAGTGAAVGKILGRSSSVKGGVGIAKRKLAGGAAICALAVVNAFGDVIAEDGTILAGPRRAGEIDSTTRMLLDGEVDLDELRRKLTVEGNTTLVCVLTDAELEKTGCAIVAKMANTGMARAVDPVHSAVDGDVVFALASGAGVSVDPMIAGVAAASLTARAIRDAVRRATSVAGISALSDLTKPGFRV